MDGVHYPKENARIRDKPKFEIDEAEGIFQIFPRDFGFWQKIFDFIYSKFLSLGSESMGKSDAAAVYWENVVVNGAFNVHREVNDTTLNCHFPIGLLTNNGSSLPLLWT